MHPPERGFGKPPRSQQPGQPGTGARPLLQGHLKPQRKHHLQSSSKGSAADAAAAGKPPTPKKARVTKPGSARSASPEG